MDERVLAALAAGRVPPPEVRRLEDKYEKVRVLGSGAFGTVHLVKPKAASGATSLLGSTVQSSSMRSSSQPRASSSTRAGASSVRQRHGTGRSGGAGQPRYYVAKELKLGSAATRQGRALLELASKEVRVLTRLNHPNVVRIVEEISEPGRTYIVMEYCPSGDLKKLLKARKAEHGFFHERDVLSMFRQLLRAVQYIHEQHLIHRDIKTENIFLSRSGRLKIGDFGLTKEALETVAMAKTICGTPMYYSPELCRALPYDSRTDIWALGCVFYEIMTLSHPFAGLSLADLPRRIIDLAYHDPNPGRRYSEDVSRVLTQFMLCPASARLGAKQLLELPCMQRDAAATSDEVGTGKASPPRRTDTTDDTTTPPAVRMPPATVADTAFAGAKPSRPVPTQPDRRQQPELRGDEQVARRLEPPSRGTRGGGRGAQRVSPPPPAKPRPPPPSANPAFAGREARVRRLLTEVRSDVVAKVHDASERRSKLGELDEVVELLNVYCMDSAGAAPAESTLRFMHAERFVTVLGDRCDNEVFADICVVLGITQLGAGEAKARTTDEL